MPTPLQTLALGLSLALAAPLPGQTVLPLWDGPPPGKTTDSAQQLAPDKGDGVQRLTHVSTPTLTLHLVDAADAPAPLVIVCPGGGYRILAIDHEGVDVARWLNTLGVSAAVLHYRVPNNRAGALLDARRAMQVARAHTDAWNVDPDRIGMLGFSAGAHLTAACSATTDRPTVSVLVYPAYLSQTDSVQLVDTIAVDADTPPAFIVQTRDDTKYYRSSLAYAAALSNADRPVELHLFARGGHGYGLRDRGDPVNDWPRLCALWMGEMGFLTPPAPHAAP